MKHSAKAISHRLSVRPSYHSGWTNPFVPKRGSQTLLPVTSQHLRLEIKSETSFRTRTARPTREWFRFKPFKYIQLLFCLINDLCKPSIWKPNHYIHKHFVKSTPYRCLSRTPYDVTRVSHVAPSRLSTHLCLGDKNYSLFIRNGLILLFVYKLLAIKWLVGWKGPF